MKWGLFKHNKYRLKLKDTKLVFKRGSIKKLDVNIFVWPLPIEKEPIEKNLFNSFKPYYYNIRRSMHKINVYT